MNSTLSITDAFIAAVHRRMIIIRMVENIGRGMFVASLFAIVLSPLAIWRSMPMLQTFLIAMVVGIIAGVVRLIVRWPTRVDAAVAADQQLRLDNLLCSAHLYRQSSDEFANAMRGMADACCTSHTPSEVMCRRFGVANWGAIVMAMSIATTLALIPFGSARSPAVDANAAVLLTSEDEMSAAKSSSTDNHTTKVNNNPTSDVGMNIPSTSNLQEDQPANPQTKRGSGRSQDSAGIGGGSATTAAKTNGDVRSGEAAGRTGDSNGVVAGGGAAANVTPDGYELANQTIVQPASKNAPVPAWSIAGDASVGATIHSVSSIDSGRVQPAHRDLVRDFFGGH